MLFFPFPIFALVVGGCNAFVHDGDSPVFTPDQADVAAEKANAGTASASGPGASIFNQKCAVCHQMSGKGIPAVYPSLTGSSIATGEPAVPIRIVLHGFQGPIVRGSQKFNGVMQPWQEVLSDQEIADVLTHVRTSWGNTAPAIDASTVAKIRAETKGKVGGFTESELQNVK